MCMFKSRMRDDVTTKIFVIGVRQVFGPNGNRIYRCYFHSPCMSIVFIICVVDMHVQRIPIFCFILFWTALSSPPKLTNYEITQRLGHSRSPKRSPSVILQSQDHVHWQPMIVASPSKRDDEEEDYLRVRSINILSTTVPIVAATHHLDMFYNSILYNALTLWTSLPPQLTLTMSLGCLQVRMSVVWKHGTPRGIPWAFVRNFARNMLGMTHKGFAGTYDMYYSSIPDGLRPEISVQVSLRVAWTSIGWRPGTQTPSRSIPRAVDSSLR